MLEVYIDLLLMHNDCYEAKCEKVEGEPERKHKRKHQEEQPIIGRAPTMRLE